MRRLMDHHDHVDAILADGANRAREIASQTMKKYAKLSGFWARERADIRNHPRLGCLANNSALAGH
ncbi:MAG: hypothetical protein R3D34_05000 [Nitratireductor sp.]